MGWKAAQKLIQNWKILRGDNVMITRGKDKGETGVIKRVVRSQNRVIVEGKNLVKKHIKQGQGHEGGIFSVEAPLHVSNVLDPVTGKPCKVGIRYLEDGTKVRISRGQGASESIIPRPEILKIRTTPRPTIGGRDLHVLRLEECKAYLRKHGLRLTGNKERCIERIQEHWRIKDGNGEKLYPRSSFTINCTGDVCQGDVVVFTHRIYKKFDIATKGGKPIGMQTVAGRVVKESYGAAKQQHTFTVEILWSKGLKKLPPLFPLLIKGRNLYRLKTYRQRWKDEAARLRVLAEKHKRGAIARHIRETTKARSSNGGSKLHKQSGKREIPLKRPRNRGTERSTKAQERVFSHGGASLAGQVKTKGAAKTKDQSGSKRKRESACTRASKKKQKNNEPVIMTTTQKPDISHVKAVNSSARHFVHANPRGNGFPMHHPIVGSHQNNYQAQIPYDYRVASPAYVASGGSYLCSEYERASTSTAGRMSGNKMAVPIPHHHAFHAGLDPRLSSCLPTRVPTGRQLNTVPPVLQKQIHKTGQLACSMSGCKDMGAKNCIGSFCWKCCRGTKRKCPRHKLP